GAVGWRLNWDFRAIPQTDDGTGDIGDNVAHALDHHHVTHANIQRFDDFVVVECGIADGDAADENRLQLGIWDNAPGAPDRGGCFKQFGRGFLCGELVSNCATWVFSHNAKFAGNTQIIDLDHHAVNLIVEIVSAGFPRGNLLDNVG